MKTRALSLPLIAAVVGTFALVIFAAPKAKAEPKVGAIRVLFLGPVTLDAVLLKERLDIRLELLLV